MFKWCGFILVMVLVNPIHSALADYVDDYQLAVKNIKAGKYQQGISLLNQISEFRQQEKQKLTLKNRKTIVYLPKYYKGLAYFYLGECADAEKNLQSSEVQRTIKNFAQQYGQLKQMREVCRSRKSNGHYVDKLAAIIQKATQNASRLTQNLKAIDKLRGEPLMVSAWDKGRYFNDRYTRIKKQSQIAKAAVDGYALTPYSKSNEQAISKQADAFKAQSQQSELFLNRLKQFNLGLSELRDELQRTDKMLKQLTALQSHSALISEWAPQGKLTGELSKLNEERNSLAEKIRKLFIVNSEQTLLANLANVQTFHAEAQSVTSKLNSTLAYTGQIIGQFDSELEAEKKLIYAGVNAFFGGRYTQAATMLNQAEVKGKRSLYFKNLFIAAAYFYNPLYSESEAKEKAKSFIRTAKSFSNKEDFDAKSFSPKFIEYYRSIK